MIFQLANCFGNGFPPEVNLYHILCGAILDGCFFEYISKRGLVSTSRLHRSGLDYLTIIYEQTPALDSFSKELLCSYNRFSDGLRSLQSFGDADGDRVDFFRFMCQKRLETLPATLTKIGALWDSLASDDKKKQLLDEAQRFIETGTCDHMCYLLLSFFGYIKDGKIAVPIYVKEHQALMAALEQLTEECIYEDMKCLLTMPEIISPLLCSKHGVNQKEIANELYHIVFGQLNEELVACGFVAQPNRYPKEGRYLQSIEIM